MRILNSIKNKIAVIFVALVVVFSFSTANAVNSQTTNAPKQVQAAATNVKSLEIVNNPKSYLNKRVLINAKFDKFSTLGLDYKPAFRSSEKYISFLIKRDDTPHNIPLSEMKLFVKRELAEKHIDLKQGDEIAITGVVFSDALGDAWIDVQDLKIINKAPDKQ